MQSNKLSIKQLAVEDRPREKMLLKGSAALSDAELLAILISSGNEDETAVQLSQRILGSVKNSLDALGKLTIKELMFYKGIGPAKALTIAAALELGRRRGVTEPEERSEIKNSIQAFKYFYPLVCDLPHEELWVALVNAKLKVIDRKMISKGGLSSSIADLRILLKEAINSTCHGIILCHNHPSGDVFPSEQDNSLTERVKSIMELLNIQLVEHIIIAEKKYFSYKDEGRI
ncbi:MAG: DNA repair protein RadC [Tannerella sp.]|jgi:DNA repair protein RadC|nr:DNA repair protein RadC [Tannerella sp.]